MRGLRIAMLAAVIMFFFFSANAQADMYRISVNGFTTNYTTLAQRTMDFRIDAFDTVYEHPPAFVKTISIKAPDTSVLSVHPQKDWLPYNRYYWKSFYATDFVTKNIPGGIYTVTVTPFVGTAIAESDTVANSFLTVSTITSPINGAINVLPTQIFKWTNVWGTAIPPKTSAGYYRVMLWNKTLNEPVYWHWGIQLNTNFNTLTMPPGILKPKSNYQLRIEARTGSLDLDKRSRSNWFKFTTGVW